MIAPTALIICCGLIPFVHFSNGNPIEPIEEIQIELVEPFDIANKLLYDLDELISSFIKESSFTKTTTSNQLYGMVGKNAEEPKGQNMIELVNNLNDLDKKLQTTFQDLQNRRRYVLGAMVRQMQNTVRRIRSNVSRMQTQMASIDAVVTQMPLIPRPILPIGYNNVTSSTESTMVAIQTNKELIDQIEERLNVVSKKISDIITRLNASLNSNQSSKPTTISTDNNINNLPQQQPQINPIKALNTIISHHASQDTKGILVANSQKK